MFEPIFQFFGVDLQLNDFNDASSQVINEFCNNPTCKVMIAKIFASSGDVKFSLSISAVDSANQQDISKILFFFRVKQVVLTEETVLESIQVISSSDMLIETLSTSLDEIWSPVAMSSGNSSLIQQSIQSEIFNATNALSMAVRKRNTASTTANFEIPIGIMSIMDEQLFWNEQHDTIDRGLHRQVSDCLVSFSQACKGNLDERSDAVLSMEDYEHILLKSEDLLLDLWKASGRDASVYPQIRISRLISLIDNYLTFQIMKDLKVIDLWNNTTHSQERITLYKQFVEAWSKCLFRLMNEWRKSATAASRSRFWKGDEVDATLSKKLITRLDYIKDTMAAFESLLHLLPSIKLSELVDVNPFNYSLVFNKDWERFERNLSASIASLESSAIARLRSEMSPLINKPHQLAQAFNRYAGILSRPAVATSFFTEREVLLAHMRAMIGSISTEIDSFDTFSFSPASAIVLETSRDRIFQMRSLRERLRSSCRLSESALSDLRAYASYKTESEELFDRIDSEEKEALSRWISSASDDLESKESDSFENGTITSINKDGMLHVHFSDFQVSLFNTCRELVQCGFNIPSKISNKATENGRFIHLAVKLRKIANFYNNLDQQIIPQQKSMLLDYLITFENTVRATSDPKRAAGRSTTGRSANDVESSVSNLQEASTRLDSENRMLRSLHAVVMSKIVRLANTDLIRQKDVWKSHWQELSTMVEETRAKFKPDACAKWVLHIDHQLFKAVQVCYQIAIETMNDSLPEVKCDLVVVKSKVQLKPALEELRSSYFREIKKVVNMPLNFKGFGANIYKRMMKRSHTGIVRLFSKAITLFSSLQAVVCKYSDWTSVSSVDLHALISENFTSVSHFESLLKEIKQKRKESEKIPEFERFDCIKVSLNLFKSYLDDMFDKVTEISLVCVRKKCLEYYATVDTFLTSSTEILSNKPLSVDEIGRSRDAWKSIDVKKDSMRAVSDECLKLKTLFLQHAPSLGLDATELLLKLSDMDGEGGRWDDFSILMEAFNEMIEEQKEQIKALLEDQIVQLSMAVDKISQRWSVLKPRDIPSWSNDDLAVVTSKFEEWRSQIDEIQLKSEKLIDNCQSFGLPKPRHDGLEGLQKDVTETIQSWGMLSDYRDELSTISDIDWIGFRQNVYALQDLAGKWSATARTRLAKFPQDAPLLHLLEEAESIRKAMPVIKICTGEPFKDEHWSCLLQGKLKISKSVRLENLKVGHFVQSIDLLLDPQLLKFVKDLHSRAQGEVTIREALQELAAWSETAELPLMYHEDCGRRTSLVKDWKDIFLQIGDKQSLFSSLKESPFYKPFEDQGSIYERKLSMLDQSLHALNQIQRKWIYLSPIFSRGALPSEQARFKRVDDEFREIMAKIVPEPRIFIIADESLFPQLQDRLDTMLDQLERCQKALSDFLEAKRSAMSRFYFIGDDDLLEILGQPKNPTIIKLHIKKLFQGINSVEFSGNDQTITTILSSQEEAVPLSNSVTINEKIEDWLQDLVNEMKRSLKMNLLETMSHQADDMNSSSQILCLSEFVRFTAASENAIRTGDLQAWKIRIADILKQLTSLDLADQNLTQIKVKALILDVIHNISVVDDLISQNCTNISDWIWQKQLRFYNQDGETKVKMGRSCFGYSFEYQGNAPKLVHTPLTDKCYLTLTHAMEMGNGGNPYGPAGTGKTESVKALGSALGRLVLVFNCDEAIDFQSMGRIFIGLIKCGAWGCFDEFNRLKEDQLSAISQQISVIQEAIKAGNRSVNLLGRNVDVDLDAAIFVTLNPAGKKYGGRSRLPDNLKALFRPVVMGKPDNELIAEVILFSEGFSFAKSLSKKVVTLFSLCQQLLSDQQHYDWGLRALKTVLNTGGKFAQQFRMQKKVLNEKSETEVLIRAIQINTLSKLTKSDIGAFSRLLCDVFPNAEPTDVNGGILEAELRKVVIAKPFYLVSDESQIKKILELKEAMDQRMGCVIVGPSGSGKSTLWQVLKCAMNNIGEKVEVYTVNPKSMPRERLLGKMDLDTREWCDGVITAAARKAVKNSNDVRSWIICDGDVDPEWIEALNSVLDDNHLLTLPNGERISFGPNVNFLFETHDLKFASPATVSRMGMIFVSEDESIAQLFVNRWISQRPVELRDNLRQWIDEIFFKALASSQRMENVLESTLVGNISNILSQVKASETRQDFVCGLVRGFSSNLSSSDRTTMTKDIITWSGISAQGLSNQTDIICKNGSVVPLSSALGECSNLTVKSMTKGSCLIPILTTARALSVIETWVSNMEPFILVGPEGCGKNLIIRQAFANLRGATVTTMSCSAQTSAADVISKLEQSCVLASGNDGRVFRPKDCDRLILYLKDINLPRPDKYNTCMIIAFLQQLLTFGGFYDDKLEFIRLERVQIVATMNAGTTVGRHPISTRLSSIVRIVAMDYPDAAELTVIYTKFLKTIFQEVADSDPKWKNNAEVEKLSATLIEIYSNTKEKFTVDDCRHYIFTPRDISLLVFGLLRYDLKSISVLDAVSNEAARIFRDRLITEEERLSFDSIVTQTIRSKWRTTSNLTSVVFTSLVQTHTESKSDEQEGSRQLVKLNMKEFRDVVRQALTMYEREEKELQILIFQEMLENLSKIDRVLGRNNGNLMLVGRSGVGRRSAVQLACYAMRYTLKIPPIARHSSTEFNIKSFKECLKSSLAMAGTEGKQTAFLVEDCHLSCDRILEYLNSVISGGEVPGLFSQDEIDQLTSPLKQIMADGDGEEKSTYDFFVKRVQTNLHVILSIDNTNPLYLMRCESNPSFYTRCSVIWLGSWSKSTLQTVPQLMKGVRLLMSGKSVHVDISNEDMSEETDFIQLNDSSNSKIDEEKEGKSESKIDYSSEHKQNRWNDNNAGKLAQEAVIVLYDSVCHQLGSTPREYVSFLRLWWTMYCKQLSITREDLSHLEAGLSKIEIAEHTVNELGEAATTKEKDLRVARNLADEAMTQITIALQQATERRREVEDIRVELARNEASTQDRKVQIESELESIVPILESAKQAVGQIKSDHLFEIRSLQAPPEAIADVLSAVLMMLGVHDHSWQSMKKFLGNRGVKEDILNFDARRMTADLRKEVTKLIKRKPESFDQSTIQRVSVAAAPLASWVKANIRYSLVLETIEPLETDLENARNTLRRSQERLHQCENELHEIDQKVSNMKNEFSRRTGEAEKLMMSLEKVQTVLSKARNLLSKLGGEKDRWVQQRSEIKQKSNDLSMQMLIASAFVTFLPYYPEDTRQSMLTQWMSFCKIDKPTSMLHLLSSERELHEWKNIGLPSDSLSQENAIAIVNSGTRVPFIVDPANVAIGWLRNWFGKSKSTTLEILSESDPRFMNQLELAVRFGKHFIATDVDQVEPFLTTLIRRDFIRHGSRLVVEIGDKLADFNENFRLTLVCRDPNPHVPPDISSIVHKINFTVTRSGLEGKLLGITIQHEQPDLERQKTDMLRKQEEYKMQLSGIEKDLLKELASAQGDILDNTALMESLTKTKETAAEIQQALLESDQASLELDRQRSAFSPFAQHGSSLYFAVTSLSSVNHMYQFSLDSFIALFKKSLDDNEATGRGRLEKLQNILDKSVFYYVGRGLFKCDRLMFGLHLVRSMHREQFGEKEWEVFLGTDSSSRQESKSNDFPQWAQKDRMEAFSALNEAIPRLVDVLDLQNASKWQRFATSVECENSISAGNLTPFQRVLIVQTFRPDRLQSSITQMVMNVLQISSISPPAEPLKILFNQTTAVTPIVFITTPGFDSSKELQDLAAETIGSSRFVEISMGGGKQQEAINALRSAASSGDWLCLKNIHLVVTWLPVLEKELLVLKPNESFRLWLTTEPHNDFPAILLQQSTKITRESPPGIKENLSASLANWNQSFNLNREDSKGSRMIFGLSLLHAILQERRTYLPQGWSKFYEFSSADLRAGKSVVQTALMELNERPQAKIDWSYIKGMLEDTVYGGRVDNSFDLRVLHTLIHEFMESKLVDKGNIMGMSLPDSSNADDFWTIVRKLPDHDAPEDFGLPANIEKSLQRSGSSQLIATLREIGAAQNQTVNFDREKWRRVLSPLFELWDRLTEADPDLGKKRKDAAELSIRISDMDPIAGFVIAEDLEICQLCHTVSQRLTAVKKVVFGSGLLTPAIQSIGSNLVNGQLPVQWAKSWEGPPIISQWLRDISKKKLAINEWVQKSVEGRLTGLSNDLRLSDLLHPSVFINALKQQTARTYKVAVDELQMFCLWGNDARPPSSKSVCVRIVGLLIQGASLTKGELSEIKSQVQEFDATPPLILGFQSISDVLVRNGADVVTLPLYASSSREILITELTAPSTKSPSRWILSGTALMLVE